MDDTILDRQALEQITAAAAGLSRSVVLELRLPEPDTDLGRRLEAVAAQITAAAAGGGGLAVVRGESVEDGPAVVLLSEGRGEIHFHAVPVGPELSPFVQALRALGGPGEEPEVATVDGPLTLDVFISPECPNCPRSVRAAVAVSAANPLAVVRIIDAAEFADLASSAGVRSVPMIVAGDGLTVVGAVDAAELLEKIKAARSGDGDGVIFGSLVDAGRFAEAAKLLSSETVRRGFVERWGSSGLEGRIGLALTAEEALTGRADILDAMVPELLPLVGAESAPLRGDTADLLGKIGHPGARRALEGLLDDDDEDVADIAADALEELRAEAGA